MRLSLPQILRLPVETQSGLNLGVVGDVVVDAEQHVVSHYIVKPALVPRMFAHELIVATSQVISLTNEKMIVEDGLVPNSAVAAAPTAAPTV